MSDIIIHFNEVSKAISVMQEVATWGVNRGSGSGSMNG